MVRKVLYILATLALSIAANGQHQRLASLAGPMPAGIKMYSNNAGLKRFIKNNLMTRSDKYIFVGCNEGNDYYRSDTIRMQQITKNYYPVWECSQFVEWHILNNGQFLWSDITIYEENMDRSYYLSATKIKMTDAYGNLYLTITRNHRVIERFRVLGVETTPSRFRQNAGKTLVLLRQPQRTGDSNSLENP